LNSDKWANAVFGGYFAIMLAALIGCTVSSQINLVDTDYTSPNDVNTEYVYNASVTNYVFTAKHDSKWRRVRDRYYATHKTCAMCGIARDIQVHHIKPWHLYPEERYSHKNLVSLCQPCHFRFGHGRNWKAYNPVVVDMAEIVNNMLTNVVYRSE